MPSPFVSMIAPIGQGSETGLDLANELSKKIFNAQALRPVAGLRHPYR